MIEERNKRPFKDWYDLIDRVEGIHPARATMFANIGGLNVNGQPLPGGPPTAAMIRFARDSLRKGTGPASR
jgi:competence protein ComEA